MQLFPLYLYFFHSTISVRAKYHRINYKSLPTEQSPLFPTLALLAIPMIVIFCWLIEHTFLSSVAFGWAAFGELALPLGICIFATIVFLVPNPMHALLALLGVFFTTVVFYLAAGIAFVGFVFLIVYVGAISVLFLYVIMLLNVKSLTARDQLVYHASQIFAVVGASVLFQQLHSNVVKALGRSLTDDHLHDAAIESTTGDAVIFYVRYGAADINGLTGLYTIQMLPFLVIIVILLVALLGSIILATTTTERLTAVSDIRAYTVKIPSTPPVLLSGVSSSVAHVGLLLTVVSASTEPLGLCEVAGPVLMTYFHIRDSKNAHILRPTFSQGDMLSTKYQYWEPNWPEPTFRAIGNKKGRIYCRKKPLWLPRKLVMKNTERADSFATWRLWLLRRRMRRYGEEQVSRELLRPYQLDQDGEAEKLLKDIIKKQQSKPRGTWLLQRRYLHLRRPYWRPSVEYLRCQFERVLPTSKYFRAELPRRVFRYRWLWRWRPDRARTTWRLVRDKVLFRDGLKKRRPNWWYWETSPKKGPFSLSALGLRRYLHFLAATRLVPFIVWWAWRVRAFTSNLFYWLIVLPLALVPVPWFVDDYYNCWLDLTALYTQVFDFVKKYTIFGSMPPVIRHILTLLFLYPAAALKKFLVDTWLVVGIAAIWAYDSTLWSASDYPVAELHESKCNYYRKTADDRRDDLDAFIWKSGRARRQRHPDKGRTDFISWPGIWGLSKSAELPDAIVPAVPSTREQQSVMETCDRQSAVGDRLIPTREFLDSFLAWSAWARKSITYYLDLVIQNIVIYGTPRWIAGLTEMFWGRCAFNIVAFVLIILGFLYVISSLLLALCWRFMYVMGPRISLRLPLVVLCLTLYSLVIYYAQMQPLYLTLQMSSMRDPVSAYKQGTSVLVLVLVHYLFFPFLIAVLYFGYRDHFRQLYWRLPRRRLLIFRNFVNYHLRRMDWMGEQWDADKVEAWLARPREAVVASIASTTAKQKTRAAKKASGKHRIIYVKYKKVKVYYDRHPVKELEDMDVVQARPYPTSPFR